MSRLSVAICLATIVAVVICDNEAVEKGVKVERAVRTLDISTQLVFDKVAYEIENTGTTPISYFLVAVPKPLESHVALVEAAKNFDEDNKKLFKVAKATVAGVKDDVLFRVSFSEPVKAGDKAKFEVGIVYSKILTPHPEYISQMEQQLVVFEGNAHVLSPYEVKEQKMTVQLSAGSVESFTKVQPTKQEGTTLVYGPYANIPPFSKVDLKIHYENNSPFLTITEFTRVIEISHWGNIAVEETVDVYHSGAKLKGSFSRFDFQRDNRPQSPAVKHWKTHLPAAAADVYYRDEIGNISTSNLRVREELVELDIRPRFPLFGGWKTHYTIGYNIPSYEYLYSSGSQYNLKMRFIDHIFDNFVVDKFTLKVILPEGSKDINFKAPYPVKRSPNEVHYTYLDTSGRPVIVAHKDNLVENHIKEFELEYKFDRVSMIREPFMVVVAFYLLFLVVIVYTRLDFTIAKDPVSEARLKVSGLVEQALNAQQDRNGCYDTWSEAIEKFKTSRDATAFAAARKKAENDHKIFTQSLTDVQLLLKPDCPEGFEKLNEVIRLDKQIRDQLASLTQFVERLVSGKMQKPQYADAEKLTKTKIDEWRQKIDSMMFSL